MARGGPQCLPQPRGPCVCNPPISSPPGKTLVLWEPGGEACSITSSVPLSILFPSPLVIGLPALVLAPTAAPSEYSHFHGRLCSWIC